MLQLDWIAGVEESRLARAMSEVADSFEPIDSGIMARGPVGTWVNTASGLGLAGPPARETVGRLIEHYAAAGIEPRIEVSPYADAALLDALSAAGFVVRVVENILFRPLDRSERFEGPSPPQGLEIRIVPPDDESRVRDCARVVAEGFAATGATARDEDVDLWVRCSRHPRTRLVAAYLQGRCVGAGSIEVSGEVAALFGASVLAAFRRRGIQRTLIAARLALAAGEGARVATIGARPRVPTERNVRRIGFQVAYTKMIMVRPGPGLTPVAG